MMSLSEDRGKVTKKRNFKKLYFIFFPKNKLHRKTLSVSFKRQKVTNLENEMQTYF